LQGLNVNVSIAKYAAMNAVLAQGTPVTEVLARAGVENSEWRIVQMDWLTRLALAARPGGRGDLQRVYLARFQAFLDDIASGEELDLSQPFDVLSRPAAEIELGDIVVTPFAHASGPAVQDAQQRASEDAQYEASRMGGETLGMGMQVIDARALMEMAGSPFDIPLATPEPSPSASTPVSDPAPASAPAFASATAPAPASAATSAPALPFVPVPGHDSMPLHDPLESTFGQVVEHVSAEALPFALSDSHRGAPSPSAPVPVNAELAAIAPSADLGQTVGLTGAIQGESLPFGSPTAPSSSASADFNETLDVSAMNLAALPFDSLAPSQDAPTDSLPFRSAAPSESSTPRHEQRGGGNTLPFAAVGDANQLGAMNSAAAPATALSLEQFSGLTARIGLQPERRREFVSAYGLDESSHHKEKEAWAQIMEAKPTTAARYARFVCIERERLTKA